MITTFSDLTADERSQLAYDAANLAARYEDPTVHTSLSAEERAAGAARWREIATAFESCGKEPHGVEPGTYTPVDGGPR